MAFGAAGGALMLSPHGSLDGALNVTVHPSPFAIMKVVSREELKMKAELIIVGGGSAGFAAAIQ